MSTRRIERIETACVAPRWGLLRMTASDGIEGFGEFTLEGQLEAGRALVQAMSEWFVGQPADDIKGLVRGLYAHNFYHGGAIYMSALAGIETALWDIAGKAAGLPVYRMLGGRVRDRVKVYRWAGGNNNSPEASAAEAASVVAQGAKAIKMNACPPLAAIDTYGGIAMAVARARAVRDAVGPDVDVAFDFHGRANVPMARKLAKALECVDPLFYEEPVRPDHNRWLKEVADITAVPIATGERMTTVAEFSDLVSAKAAHVLQPDLVHVGGIANTAEIAALAEANGIALAPHCPLSPIAFAANLQVVVQARAGWILEWSKGIHYNAHGAAGEVDPWLRYVDERDWPLFDVDATGHLPVPEAPGLGVRFNWDEIRRADGTGESWKDIEMHLADGTLANW
jgi:galactonate dehydratase